MSRPRGDRDQLNTEWPPLDSGRDQRPRRQSPDHRDRAASTWTGRTEFRQEKRNEYTEYAQDNDGGRSARDRSTSRHRTDNSPHRPHKSYAAATYTGRRDYNPSPEDFRPRDHYTQRGSRALTSRATDNGDASHSRRNASTHRDRQRDDRYVRDNYRNPPRDFKRLNQDRSRDSFYAPRRDPAERTRDTRAPAANGTQQRDTEPPSASHSPGRRWRDEGDTRQTKTDSPGQDPTERARDTRPLDTNGAPQRDTAPGPPPRQADRSDTGNTRQQQLSRPRDQDNGFVPYRNRQRRRNNRHQRGRGGEPQHRRTGEKRGDDPDRTLSDDPNFVRKIKILNKIIKAVHHLKNVSDDEKPPVTMSRTVKYLTDLIKPALPTPRILKRIADNAKDWSDNMIIDLRDHYEKAIKREIEILFCIGSTEWKEPFIKATKWAKNALGSRLEQTTLDRVKETIQKGLKDLEKEDGSHRPRPIMRTRTAADQTAPQVSLPPVTSTPVSINDDTLPVSPTVTVRLPPPSPTPPPPASSPAPLSQINRKPRAARTTAPGGGATQGTQTTSMENLLSGIKETEEEKEDQEYTSAASSRSTSKTRSNTDLTPMRGNNSSQTQEDFGLLVEHWNDRGSERALKKRVKGRKENA